MKPLHELIYEIVYCSLQFSILSLSNVQKQNLLSVNQNKNCEYSNWKR